MVQFEHPIQKVTEFVLTEWAMMLIEPAEAPEETFSADRPFLNVTVNYQGVFDGELTIICQRGFVDLLARNVLGIDSDHPVKPGEEWDALRELANIVSGNFLAEAYGTEVVFDLPSFKTAETDFQGSLPFFRSEHVGRSTAFYLADGEPVFVCFDIRASEY